MLKFGMPMIWRELQNHIDDCYFCLIDIASVNTKKRKSVNHQSLGTAIRHVPHSSETLSLVFEGFSSSNIEELDNANDFADMGENDNGMVTILRDYQLNRFCLTRKN